MTPRVTDAVRVVIPSKLERAAWTSLSDTGFSDEQIFEIVMRWCDQEDWRRAYRLRRNARLKLVAARMSAVEALARSAGLSVEEYLEIEAENLAPSASPSA